MKKKLIIVIPFLNEEDNLSLYKNRIEETERTINNINIEFLFVDDGSTDNSFEIVKNLSLEMNNVKVIKLSKNYGSHYAIFAAIDNLKECDYFSFMSADMQEPIHLYQDMLTKFNSDSNIDIVLADRQNRNTDKLSILFSKIYNSLVQKYAISNFPTKGVDIFMLNVNVLKSLQNMNIKNTSIYGNIFNMGYTKEYVPYFQLSRNSGQSKWTFQKKVKMFIDTFVSFSVVPLRLITILGVIFSTIGFGYGLYIILMSLFGNIVVEGWSTLVALNTFGFGLLFLMLGIISEYIWRIYDQINPNKSYIIKEKIGFDE
ncbi:glycosyltransferase [uncultured Arcobacter sp.]|uniref:glycosyltransferase n=1 Tax=uncultured Arcobacter sp. TaxID=165434 RepID=UPI00261F5E70|nr:glycosyltransferase [uncultured Arcobacter sp.]